jgi:hypothetical protein
LENALYENSDKTASQVCEIAGVGRRTFFAYIAEKETRRPTLKFSRSLWLGVAELPVLKDASPGFACSPYNLKLLAMHQMMH